MSDEIDWKKWESDRFVKLTAGNGEVEILDDRGLAEVGHPHESLDSIPNAMGVGTSTRDSFSSRFPRNAVPPMI
jgi:hypothetical protein